MMRGYRLDSSDSGYRQASGFCENVIERLSSHKILKFLAWLRSCQLLNKDFDEGSLLLNYVQVPVWWCTILHFADGASDYQEPILNPNEFML